MTTYDEATARAGADKDTDEAAWHATRQLGITATQVRDLLKNGAKYRRELLAIKRGERTDDFAGNRYTDWGNLREAALAPVLYEAGIVPESRVFLAADNPRFLASPDGVGVEPISGDIVLAEIKTTKHDLTPYGEHFNATGYYTQMQWQMHVMGAARTLFVWERHDDNWPEPTPETPRAVWIERDDDHIAQLVEVAADFLAELDGDATPITERELQRIRVQADAMAYHRAAEKQAEAKLRELIGERQLSVELDSKKFAGISVSYSGRKPKVRHIVDEEQARIEHAEAWQALEAAREHWGRIAAAYTRQVPEMSSGRLVVKEKKEQGK